MSLTETEAKFQLILMNSSAAELTRVDAITKLTNFGLPQEIITRIDDLWSKTKSIGSQTIYIGKIIVLEIIKFVKENPHLVIGLAVGAAIGALVSMIPFIGPILAPLATAISALIGGIAGYRLDQGNNADNGLISISQDLIMIAKKFFQLLANVFNALQNQLS